MAGHRYWRAFVTTYGGGPIQLSEFQLLSGTTRLDASATLTASTSPTSGSLSYLSDNSAASTAAFPAGTVFNWDAGSGNTMDVNNIQLGAGSSAATFPLVVDLQYADTLGTWTDYGFANTNGILYPGPNTMTTTSSSGTWDQFHKGPGVLLDNSRLYALFANSANAVRGASSITSAGGGTQKFYFEVWADAYSSIGLCTASTALNVRAGDSSAVTYMSAGQKNSSGSVTTLGAAYTTGDIIGVLLDCTTATNATLYFYKNGVLQPSFGTITNGVVYPIAGITAGASTVGQFIDVVSPFAYPVAGATPWASGTPLIQTSGVPASPGSLGPIVVTPVEAAPVGPWTYPAIAPVVLATNPAMLAAVSQPQPANVFAAGSFGSSDGVKSISGTVYISGTPNVADARSLVRAYEEQSGALVGATTATPAGTFSIYGLDPTKTYTIVSYDYTGAYQAVLYNGVVPA